MYSSKFKKSCNAVAEAADDEPVHGSGVVDLRKIGATLKSDRGESEHSCDS